MAQILTLSQIWPKFNVSRETCHYVAKVVSYETWQGTMKSARMEKV